MGVYSALKSTVQYSALSLALFAGMGAGSMNESVDSKVRYVRKPREPCVLPPEHRVPQEPVNFPKGAVYFGLAALAVGYVANEMRKKADSFVVSRPDSPKNFFGDEEEF
jgi:hypothetical protein